jgi:PAS domain S-box-containing protein
MDKHLRALIIEDDEDDSEFMLRELRRSGYDVDFERVDTAEAMKAILPEKNWDLILSDYSMRRFSALEALKVLKARGLDLPFIIISSSAGEDSAAALEAGANNFLVKENIAKLGPVIKRELHEAELRRGHKRAEQAMQTSEELFATAFCHSPVGICITEVNGKLQTVSQSFLDMLGYTRVELEGKHFNDITHPDDLEIGKDALVRMMSCEAPHVSFEKRYICKTGESIWALVSCSLLRDSLGQPVHFITHILNMNTGKQAEDALRESQMLLSGIIESAIDAIITIDEDQRITLFNPAAEDIFGYSATDIIGKPLDILLPERFRSIHHEHIRTYGSAHIAKRPMGGIRVLYGLRATGEEFPVEVFISYLEVSSQKFYTVILRDISERQRAEETLRESEEKFQNIVLHSSSVFYIHKADHVLVYLSPQTRDILDCEPEEAMVRWQEFLSDHPANRQGIESTQRAMETGRRQPPYELELITHKGRKI